MLTVVSSCDPALSVHDNVNHHQDNKRDQPENTFTLIGSQLVVMVLRAQWPLGTIAQLFHFVAEEKKNDKKNKIVLWLGYHRYPSKKHRILDHVVIKKEYPYNYNEDIHKIHLSDREIITIRIKVYKVYKVYKAYKTFVAFKT